MNSHFNKTTTRTSNNLKDILTTEHEAIQNLKNTIQILETTHNTLTNNKTCFTCAHSLGIIRKLKKTIKRIKQSNKLLKNDNSKISKSWNHWINHHQDLNRQIEDYQLISNSNHQIMNHSTALQQKAQTSLEDWKKNSNKIKEYAKIELTKLSQKQESMNNPTN